MFSKKIKKIISKKNNQKLVCAKLCYKTKDIEKRLNDIDVKENNKKQ